MKTFVIQVMALSFSWLEAASHAATNQVYEKVEYDKYCPHNPCQPPDSHYVCDFFTSKRKPSCKSYHIPLTFNNDDVATLLSKFNKLRSEIASGIATGKDGGLFKRGYGFYVMEWDARLAGMAQLYVDTCDDEKKQYELCSQIYKFPKTRSVLVNSVLYNYRLESRRNASHKAADDIDLNLPDSKDRFLPSYLEQCPENVCGRSPNVLYSYGLIMQSNARYIGCATAIGDVTKPNPDNFISSRTLHCFVSHDTEVGQRLYNMTPPALGTGFTNMCGCPPDFREVDGCLCEEYHPTTLSTLPMYDAPYYKNKQIRGPVEPAVTDCQGQRSGDSDRCATHGVRNTTIY